MARRRAIEGLRVRFVLRSAGWGLEVVESEVAL